MSLTMNPCRIAAGPTFKPCIIQTQPITIINTPSRLFSIRIITSKACDITSLPW